MPESMLKNCFHLSEARRTAEEYITRPPADNTFAPEPQSGKRRRDLKAMDATQPYAPRCRIAVLARRSGSMRRMLDGALRAEGINADVSVYGRGGCDVLAAFDTGLPVRRVVPPDGCVPIVYSGSGRVRRALGGCPLPCVTCGTAAYDTVTVSSLSEGSAMLTVQRELRPLRGGIIEPCELPLRYRGCDIYKALLCASVVLVCAGMPQSGVIILRA